MLIFAILGFFFEFERYWLTLVKCKYCHCCPRATLKSVVFFWQVKLFNSRLLSKPVCSGTYWKIEVRYTWDLYIHSYTYKNRDLIRPPSHRPLAPHSQIYAQLSTSREFWRPEIFNGLSPAASGVWFYQSGP